jgi:hypothetical protein
LPEVHVAIWQPCHVNPDGARTRTIIFVNTQKTSLTFSQSANLPQTSGQAKTHMHDASTQLPPFAPVHSMLCLFRPLDSDVLHGFDSCRGEEKKVDT